MELLKLLKQLKNIEPDRDYALRSKSLILSAARFDAPAVERKTLWSLLFENRMRSAVVLGAIFLAAAGVFASSKIFAPLAISTLDPAALRAEAEAIDIQIQLTNLTYSEVAPDGNETTPAVIPARKEAAEKAQDIGLPTQASSSLEISIDQILEVLSR